MISWIAMAAGVIGALMLAWSPRWGFWAFIAFQVSATLWFYLYWGHDPALCATEAIYFIINTIGIIRYCKS